MEDNAKEIFPLVNAQGEVVGSATRGECHAGSMLLHPVVHLHLFNSHGELYLQQRPAWKDIQPSRWDSGVGGHVDYGETTLEALLREAREELGVEEFTPEYLTSYIFESSVEREYVNIFYTTYDKEVTPSAETDGGAFWSIQKIQESLNRGVFTPNFESEFVKYIQPLIS
ncbi:MAG: NUDIX domain-containing protein [Rikenellaceae bacterium]